MVHTLVVYNYIPQLLGLLSPWLHHHNTLTMAPIRFAGETQGAFGRACHGLGHFASLKQGCWEQP